MLVRPVRGRGPEVKPLHALAVCIVLLLVALLLLGKQSADCEALRCKHGVPRYVYRTGCLCVEVPQ